MKWGQPSVPSWSEYLSELSKDSRIGLDPKLFTYSEVFKHSATKADFERRYDSESTVHFEQANTLLRQQELD